MKKALLVAAIAMMGGWSCAFVSQKPLTPPGGSCVNQCGDGRCAEVVCLGTGCPCAENNKTCPQDCVAPTPQPPAPPSVCGSYGSCKNGEACPQGTICSGLPAYGCYPPGCPYPICLASNVLIRADKGDVPVSTLHEGDRVWSTDARGQKILEPIEKIISRQVEPNHKIVHIQLADGREVWASPGHPTADGRTVDTLKQGDPLDGSTVDLIETIPYWDSSTWDLLPAGETGTYWADGILLKSTLAK